MEMLSNASSMNANNSEFNNIGGDYNRIVINQGNKHNLDLRIRSNVNLDSESRLSKFQQLLPAVDCASKHREVRSVVRAQPTAGKWLLTHKTYTSWKAGLSPSLLLWLLGIRESRSPLVCSLLKYLGRLDSRRREDGTLV